MALDQYAEACISLHQVRIYDRGGKRKVADLIDIAEVTYSREEGRRTSARIVISGDACRRQIDVINRIAAHRHEVVIYRGSRRVWEGPLLEPRWYVGRVEIVALDVTAYLDTPLSRDWPNEDGGGPRYMTERVEQILTHELSVPYEADVGIGGVVDMVTMPRWENFGAGAWPYETWGPPINVLPHLEVRPSLGPQGILTLSDTVAFQMHVSEHLQDLARGGLQYTAIGRKILVWDRAQSIGSTRPLTDADFYGEIAVIAAGGEHAVIAHVSAQRDEDDEEAPDDGGVGNAGAPDPFYGAWTRLVSLASEDGTSAPSQMELNSQARRQLVGRNPVPTQIIVPTGAGLRLSDDLTIDDLIPGVVMPVRAEMNLRPVSQKMRLERVTIRETADEGESIQVELSPAGDLEALP